MVDPKELRIGNWVTCNYPVGTENDIVLIVDGRDECVLVRGNYLWVRKSILAPIPLTSEILEKAGLPKVKDGCMSPDIYERKYTRRIVENIFTFHFDGKDGYWIEGNTIVEVNHLHQLQNLYFSLTGEELEINL